MGNGCRNFETTVICPTGACPFHPLCLPPPRTFGFVQSEAFTDASERLADLVHAAHGFSELRDGGCACERDAKVDGARARRRCVHTASPPGPRRTERCAPVPRRPPPTQSRGRSPHAPRSSSCPKLVATASRSRDRRSNSLAMSIAGDRAGRRASGTGISGSAERSGPASGKDAMPERASDRTAPRVLLQGADDDGRSRKALDLALQCGFLRAVAAASFPAARDAAARGHGHGHGAWDRAWRFRPDRRRATRAPEFPISSSRSRRGRRNARLSSRAVNACTLFFLRWLVACRVTSGGKNPRKGPRNQARGERKGGESEKEGGAGAGRTGSSRERMGSLWESRYLWGLCACGCSRACALDVGRLKCARPSARCAAASSTRASTCASAAAMDGAPCAAGDRVCV